MTIAKKAVIYQASTKRCMGGNMEAIEKIQNKLVIGKKSRVAKVMLGSFDNQEISSP